MRNLVLAIGAKIAIALLVIASPSHVQAQANTSNAQVQAPAVNSSAASATSPQNTGDRLAQPSRPKTKKLGIIIFPGFETLDVFGPVQMWARMPDYEVVMVSENGGPIRSSQGYETMSAYSFANAPQLDILMIPGGGGTRREVNNPVMIEFLRRQDRGTDYTTSVCTGAAVLAKAGILQGRKATTNKRAWTWATSQGADVAWQTHARWVVDGKYVTSSGISAGTDMALGLVEKIYGRERAERIARGAEYIWNDSPANDPFAIDISSSTPQPSVSN